VTVPAPLRGRVRSRVNKGVNSLVNNRASNQANSLVNKAASSQGDKAVSSQGNNKARMGLKALAALQRAPRDDSPPGRMVAQAAAVMVLPAI